jgi:CubicO group peptidase (beta-lactamase class C family)
MDSELLARLLDFIQEQEYDIHSVTIVRNGYLIADATIYPFAQGTKHNLHSCTKSITSALIGITIEQGYIESAEQPVLSFFPNRTTANIDAHKEAMTLEDLLTMATGLDCTDSYLYNWRGLEEMLQTDDWIQFMLDLPMKEPPGTRFEYCNGASFLLSAIIQEMTGMNTAVFAETHLFRPLGISDVVWPVNFQGITIGWGELRMRPQDMAKIGYLYLNEGRWDGQQIIPAEWVATSTHRQIAATITSGYGYQWWVSGDGIYMAMGTAGQYIIVAPEIDLVVVFTSNLEDSTIPFGLLYDFIIPAAKAPTPIAPNPDGVQLLESKIQQVALAQTESEPAPFLPQTAERITGKNYTLDPNPSGLMSIALTFQEEMEALFSWTAHTDIVSLDQQAANQGDWPVGLDNVYRFTPGPFGLPMGLRGQWVSEDTFVISIDSIGNTGKTEIRFDFEGDDLTMQIRDLYPNPDYQSFTGKLED